MQEFYQNQRRNEQVIRWQIFIHELSASFFENVEVAMKIKKKNDYWMKFFLVEGWSINSHVRKVVERIVMDFGLLILHETKVLIL